MRIDEHCGAPTRPDEAMSAERHREATHGWQSGGTEPPSSQSWGRLAGAQVLTTKPASATLTGVRVRTPPGRPASQPAEAPRDTRDTLLR